MLSLFHTIADLVPLALSMGVMSIGLILLWIPKKLKMGKIFLSIGLLSIFIFSLPAISNHLIYKFERQYTAFGIKRNGDGTALDFRYVVILASEYIQDPELPITSQLSSQELIRLVEGIRLYRKQLNAKIVLSGGVGKAGIFSDADMMSRLSVDLGVPTNDIILEIRSQNTFEQAKFIKEIVKNEKFILVTSAIHMPRAMAIFKNQKIIPIPAPTDYLIKTYRRNKFNWIIPSESSMISMKLFLYEFMAFTKEKFLNNI